MKLNNYAGFVLVSVALAGCGGGGASAPGVPPQPPAPTLTLQSGSLSRILANGTSISLALSAQTSNFASTDPVYADAIDSSAGLALPVTVTANGGGNYTLTLDTPNTLPGGHYAGNITVRFCRDQACNGLFPLPSLSVPYDLTVMSKGAAWPGDKLTALAAMSGATDWSTFQGNAAHTGFVPVDVNPDKMSLRWKRGALNASSSGYNALLSTLVTANGQFYASGSNKLTAYKELDGSEVWHYDVSALQYPSVNPPAVDGGVVYMAAGQQSSTFLMAFDAANGNLRFKTPMSSQWEHYLAPVVYGGGVYTNAGSYGGMYGFNLNGEKLYFGNLSQTAMWTPAADARAIYAYTGDALTMFDAKTGAILSSIKDSGFTNYVYEVGGAPVIGANGGVYAAAYQNGYLNGGAIGNSLVRFDTLKGFLDWRVGGVYTVTPAYANGVLYAPNGNPYRLEARAEADGKLLWSWTPPMAGETAFYGAPVVTKNLLFVSTNLNTYAIDLTSHKAVWSYPAPGHVAISQNGVLYLQNPDALVAINLK